MNKKQRLIMENLRGEDFSKLHFVAVDFWDQREKDQSDVELEVRRLKNNNTIILDRVLRILEMTREFATYDSKNRFQCRPDANRSVLDIWRIYVNYFPKITIFEVMKALYKLVVEEQYVGTLFCHDINKQVFFSGDTCIDDVFADNELGIRFAEWREI